MVWCGVFVYLQPMGYGPRMQQTSGQNQFLSQTQFPSQGMNVTNMPLAPSSSQAPVSQVCFYCLKWCLVCSRHTGHRAHIQDNSIYSTLLPLCGVWGLCSDSRRDRQTFFPADNSFHEKCGIEIDRSYHLTLAFNSENKSLLFKNIYLEFWD